MVSKSSHVGKGSGEKLVLYVLYTSEVRFNYVKDPHKHFPTYLSMGQTGGTTQSETLEKHPVLKGTYFVIPGVLVN